MLTDRDIDRVLSIKNLLKERRKVLDYKEIVIEDDCIFHIKIPGVICPY